VVSRRRSALRALRAQAWLADAGVAEQAARYAHWVVRHRGWFS